MKIVHIALIAATALGAGMTASYADNGDSPTARQQAENLWIATGDPAFARAAGLTEAQIQATHRMPIDRTNLGE